jgi:hypothetical protein
MKESALPLTATVIGLAYVLAYAWAQLEILASILALWNTGRKVAVAALSFLWAAMNCFSFLIAHDVHFDVIRERRLVLFEIDTLPAKASAVLIILVYWAWVICSFYFALRRSRKAREAVPPAP